MWQRIIELLKQGEGETVEFKKNLLDASDLLKDVVALANTKGGEMVLGIDDKNGHLIGETVSREWIEAVLSTKCTPKIHLDIQVMEKAEKTIFLLTIPLGKLRPYYAENICYLREGILTRKAEPEEEQKLLAERQELPEEELLITRTLPEINAEIDSSSISNVHLNERQKKALEYVGNYQKITNKIYRRLSGISHKTAHIELTELVGENLLKIQGKGRSTCYIAASEIAGEPG